MPTSTPPTASKHAAEAPDVHAGPVPHAPKSLLRLITCGSVDDGKSTLIGRLLFDTKSVHADQLAAVEHASLARGQHRVDLSLLTDGLRAEREQGITIDVAYRYFATPRRAFILADTPGHVQYTRNMATGASTADAALILIDARHGVVEQTRRHACLAALLGIPHLVVCVNKIDLVGFDHRRFDDIRADFLAFAASADPDGSGTLAARASIDFVPLSALGGDNVVAASASTPWHAGPALLPLLESLPDRAEAGSRRLDPARFPVQYVIRPRTPEHHDYRGYAGQVASGRFRVGDRVVALPGGQRSRISRIHTGPDDAHEAFAPQSVCILLEDELDIARGDLLVHERPSPDAADAAAPPPRVSRDLEATLIWMSQEPLSPNRRVLVKHAAKTTPAVVRSIGRRLNIRTLALDEDADRLGLNEIARVALRCAAPLAADPYTRCRATGSFILIDEQTNDTLAAGLIL